MNKYFESVEDFQKNGSAGDFYIAMDSNPKRLEDEELWIDIYIKPFFSIPPSFDYASVEPVQEEINFDDLPPVEPKKFIKINLLNKRVKKKTKVTHKELGDIIYGQP